MQYAALSDAELADLLRTGDKGAFTEIYNRYNGILFTYAFKLTRDTDAAKDIVQDLFISLWDKRQFMELTTGLSSYLYSAVRYKFLKTVAHQKVKTAYAEKFLSIFEQASYTTDHYITDKELSAEVEKLVACLPAKMARIFTLSRLEYRSHQEIALEMNIAEKTVKNLLSEAVKNLRLKIGAWVTLILLLQLK